MILELVDRAAAAGTALTTELHELLPRLAEPTGRPRWRCDLVLVQDGRIAALNEQYRGRAEPTDVLSFSYLLPSGPGKPDLPAGESHAAVDLWRDPAEADADDCVGEILLAPAFVAERCRRRAWPWPDELAMLTVHGLLHVLGWEHERAGQRERMQRSEAQLLELCGLTHPLLERGTES